MKVRMLLATCVLGFDLLPNMVPSLPPDDVTALQEIGAADPHPDAVAYAEALDVALPEGFPNFEEKPAGKTTKKNEATDTETT